MASLGFRIAGFLGKGLISLIFRSLRIETIGNTNIQGHILGMFHGDLFVFTPWVVSQKLVQSQGRKIVIMVSKHRDGEYLHQIITRFGGATIRGDTRHDSFIALRKILAKIKKGHSSIFAVDGPVGPRETIEPGVLFASLSTRRPINMIFAWVKRRWTFSKAWDKFYIPKPFSRARIYVSQDFLPDPKLSVPENLKIFRHFLVGERGKFNQCIEKI